MFIVYYLKPADKGHGEEIIKNLPYVRLSVCHIFT